jgi:hypothetical protein
MEQKHFSMKLFRFDKTQDALQTNRKSVSEVQRTMVLFFGVVMKAIRDPLRVCFLLLIILFISSNASFCEIRNGYEKDIFILKESLKNLSAILTENKDLSGVQRRKMESKVELLINHISFYDLTENLLNQFKIIAPKLYAEIDTISDRKGRPVHVYVKFVPVDATKVKAWGVTYLNQVKSDQDAYLSEYGELTVSIQIWIVPKALQVLSHELGHVKYQIPNLASYMNFHKKFYKDMGSNYIGHHPQDPSGKIALQAEKLFRKEHAYFLKTTNEKIQNPVILLTKIRKNMNPKHYAVASTWRPTVTM